MVKKKTFRFKRTMSLATAENVTAIATTEKKDVEKNDVKVRNWMLALGIGAGVALAAAGTVYYVKSKRASARKASRYNNSLTVEDYEGTMQKWWGLTTRIFSAVRSTVSEFLTKNKSAPPFPPSSQTMMSPFDTSDQEVVLDEGQF